MINIKTNYGNLPIKIKEYVKDNWGSPLISSFIVLLLLSAFFLTAGWLVLAERTAVFAYFALIFGVILQLVVLSKNKKDVSGKHGAN